MGKKIPILKTALISTISTLCFAVSSASATEYTPILEAPDPNGVVGGFLITSINPSLETMTLRYTDPMEAWFKEMGIPSDPIELTSLYMFWLEPGKNNPEKDARYTDNYAKQIENGETEPGVHAILARNNNTDGTDWLEVGKETEFQIKGSNLSSPDFDGRIFHKLSGNNEVIWSKGSVHISECINSPDYVPGMDCKLMMRDDGRFVYLPTARKAIEEPIPELAPEPKPEELEVITGMTVALEESPDPVKMATPKPSIREEITNLAVAPVKVEPLVASDNSNDIGVPTANKKSKQVKDNPVWVISLVIFLCSGVLLWFFLPKKRKKCKKV